MKTQRATITEFDDSGEVAGVEDITLYEPETVEELTSLLDTGFDGEACDLEQFGSYTPDFAE